MRVVPTNPQFAVHHNARNARMIERRIRRMEKRIRSGEGSGWYDRRILQAGLRQDDSEEYGDRYTGRQGTSSLSHQPL